MGRRGRQLPPTGPGRTLLCAPVCRMTFRSSTFPTGTRDILSPYAAPPAPRGPGGGRSPGPPPPVRKGRERPRLLPAACRKRSPQSASSWQHTLEEDGRGGRVGTEPPRSPEPRRPNRPAAAPGTGGQRPAPPRGLRGRDGGGCGAGSSGSRRRTGKAADPQSAALPVAPSLGDGGRHGGPGAGLAALVAAGRDGGERARSLPSVPAAAACRGRAALRPAGASPVPAGPSHGGLRGVWRSASRPGAAAGNEGRVRGRRGAARAEHSAAARLLAGSRRETAVHQHLRLEKGAGAQGPH